MKYKDIAINAQFILNNQKYTKIKTVWKSCCTKLYNAIDFTNPDKKILVNEEQEVTNE